MRGVAGSGRRALESLLVGGLALREAAAVDAVVDVRLHPLVDGVDFSLQVCRTQVHLRVLRDVVELAVQESHNL